MSLEKLEREVSHITTQSGHQEGRDEMASFNEELKISPIRLNKEFQHSIEYYFKDHPTLLKELEHTSKQIPLLEELVMENDFRLNLPRFEPYDGIGRRIDEIKHHPSYLDAGDIIYGTEQMKKMSRPGSLLESLLFFYLTSHAGEAGHNCPVACTAGIIRVLTKTISFSKREEFLEKLTAPSYRENWTGAQFLTEIQGGSDVGRNDTRAFQGENGTYKIVGEKWFCSNAHAELILLTARYDQDLKGTRGLGLFLVPKVLENGSHNDYTIRRLKEKLGTRTMASGEIDFRGATAYHMGPLEGGFKMVMENVLHLSRIYNTFSVTGSVRRAFQIARSYARNRKAFGQPIQNYPLVAENLVQILAENTALAAGGMYLAHFQDQLDLKVSSGEELDPAQKLLNRLFANLNKYVSALWSVDHLHHCIDVLAGNGAIESFSSLPRLFRDSIVCENWEGTHNTLRMQVLRDILRYSQDEIFLEFVQSSIEKSGEIPALIQDSLNAHIESLKENLESLKSAPDPVKTLLARDVLDEMSEIYLCICLLKEALHQKSTGGESKTLLLESFCIMRMQKKKNYSPENLSRIEKIMKSC